MVPLRYQPLREPASQAYPIIPGGHREGHSGHLSKIIQGRNRIQVWARCNHDGKPIHPDDQTTMDKFKKWLLMTETNEIQHRENPNGENFQDYHHQQDQNKNMRHKWKAEKNPCNVFWGTHGCRKQRGHMGKHLCQPGCRPIPELGETGYEYTFGEDWKPLDTKSPEE